MKPSRRVAVILLIVFTILCIQYHHYNSLSTTNDFYATRRLEDDDTADIIQQTYHNLKKDGLEPGTDEFTSKLRYQTHEHIKQIKPDYARQNIIQSRTRNELITKGYDEDSESFTNMLHTKSLRRIDSSEKTWFKKLINRMVIQEKIDNHIAKVSSGTSIPNQSASSSRLITMNDKSKEEEIQKFPFHYAPESCVHVEDIIHITEFIKDLYIKHNIRVFPRNGFLLGIVRHGGFLPIEAMDVDMGVVYEDLLPLYDDDRFEISQSTNGDKRAKGYLDDFFVRLKPPEVDWVNWHGYDPETQQRYPYMDAMLTRDSYKMHVVASYPYRDTGGYFYPRFDKADFNHDVHVADALRYNEEGADYRLVDTDERINSSNVSITLGYFVFELWLCLPT